MPAYAEHGDYRSWLEETFPADGPGATVLLMRDDEVLFRGAAGLANLELDVAMRPDHVLRIGSITKQFTAAAILLLQDLGELNVSDEITLYLPEFPAHGEPITIAHLLSHTSGIRLRSGPGRSIQQCTADKHDAPLRDGRLVIHF